MAEYSKEYCKRENVSIPFDFSYEEIANNLSDNQTVYEICEGMGTIGITRIENKVYLIDRNKELIEFITSKKTQK